MPKSPSSPKASACSTASPTRVDSPLACAKAGAAKVTAVDVSATACEAARQNAIRNGVEIEVLEHNVFDLRNTPNPSMT